MSTIAGCPATIKNLAPHALRSLLVHRYAGLFRPVEGDERERLITAMKSGYDDAHPIVVWEKTGEIVDGRNRRDIALELEMSDVPVAYVAFPDETAVSQFVVAQNLARRHMTTKERSGVAGQLIVNGTSVRDAARATGVSKTTAQRAATKARKSGVPNGTRAKRTTGTDGKSYPATREQKTKAPTPRLTTASVVRDIEQATTHLRDLIAQGPLTAQMVGRLDRARDGLTNELNQARGRDAAAI
jgi:ParB-like chromosome segregation protein Spo0J